MSFVPNPPYQQELLVGQKLKTGQMMVSEVRVLDWDHQWWIVTNAGWKKINVKRQKLLHSPPESGNLQREGEESIQ